MSYFFQRRVEQYTGIGRIAVLPALFNFLLNKISSHIFTSGNPFNLLKMLLQTKIP